MPDQGAGLKTDWVHRVLGVDIAVGAPPQPPGGGVWQTARGEAIIVLDRLAAAVDKLDIPEAPKAVILLRSIRANLTQAPTTPQQFAELRRYLQTDDVIAEAEHPNGFGINVALRVPLLAALDAEQSRQGATT